MGRRAWAVATAAAMTMVGFGPAGAAPPPRQDVIVVLDDDVRDPRAAAADMARQHDARVTHVYEHVFGGFAASIPEGRRGALERDARVVRVDDDRLVHATAETIPTGVARISAPTAHSTETGTDPATGAALRVGILDTGIRTHDDLAIDRTVERNCTTTSSTDDVHGHGTHVAGTVGAVDNDIHVLGVAPAVRVVPVKVLNDSGSGSWSTVACGLDHAAAEKLPVVNLSLGGARSSSDTVKPCGESTGDALYLSICGAITNGVTVVVAAGNDGQDASNFIPAAYPDVITVSALEDHNGTADTGGTCSGRGPWQTCEDVLASFSNHGSVIDVIAPGVAITSTTNNGGTGSKSGTSMAAPHVAGVAALIIGAHGAIGHHAVRDHLLATGQCPDTAQAVNSSCGTQTWPRDPDGTAEPLIHANWAVTTVPGGGSDPAPDPENAAPTASFTYECTDLDCVFTDASSDTDGTIASWAWDFGDGSGVSSAQSPSYTYAAGGTYTVTLTVTDDDGATGSVSQPVTVTAPDSGGISLTVATRKLQGTKYADLAWGGATTTTVDIWVDGTKRLSGSDNDEAETLSLGKGGGTHTFRVCEAGTAICSADVTATW